MSIRASSRKIRNIITRLEEEGILTWLEDLFESFPNSDVYLVGGTVRDLLLNRSTADYDFVVRGVAVAKLQKFLKKLGNVDLVGKRFGVFKFRPFTSKITLDIALPRREQPHSFTGKHQDFDINFDPNLPIEKDLERRDFTINAMALSLRKREISDPYGGLRDLKKKTIQAVSDPKKRFKEDYSRMLRALRFSLQLNFKIEENTFRVLKSLMSHINDTVKGVRVVPYEIVAEEFLKSFMANPVKAFNLYEKSGALRELIPELLLMRGCKQEGNWHIEGDVWQHTKLALSKLNSKMFKTVFPEGVDCELVVATLFHDLGKVYTKTVSEAGETHFYGHEKAGAQTAKNICQRLKLFSARTFSINCDNLAWLVKNHLLIIHAQPDEIKPSTLEKYFFNPRYPGKSLLKLFLVDALSTIPGSGKVDLSRFKKLMARIREMTDKKGALPKPLLSGEEIMRILKIPPGPEVGRILKVIREEQLSLRIKTKREAGEYIKSEIRSTKFETKPNDKNSKF